jgi:hypothetical protein
MLDEIEKNDVRNKQKMVNIFNRSEQTFEHMISLVENNLKKSQEVISIINKQNIRKSRKIAKLEEEISKLKRN